MSYVRSRPSFDFDAALKADREIHGKREALRAKLKTPGYTPTEADTLEWQELADRQNKEVDIKVNKLVERFQRYAQLSKERIDRLTQGMSQGMQSPNAGALTFLAVAFTGAAVAVLKRQHNRMYRDVLPIKRPRRREIDQNARYMDRALEAKLFT